MNNLPPGCTESDIERHAEGSCPDCGKTLRDGYCAVCETVICDKCGAMVDPYGCEIKDGAEMCEKCAEQAEQQTESETE